MEYYKIEINDEKLKENGSIINDAKNYLSNLKEKLLNSKYYSAYKFAVDSTSGQVKIIAFNDFNEYYFEIFYENANKSFKKSINSLIKRLEKKSLNKGAKHSKFSKMFIDNFLKKETLLIDKYSLTNGNPEGLSIIISALIVALRSILICGYSLLILFNLSLFFKGGSISLGLLLSLPLIELAAFILKNVYISSYALVKTITNYNKRDISHEYEKDLEKINKIDKEFNSKKEKISVLNSEEFLKKVRKVNELLINIPKDIRCIYQKELYEKLNEYSKILSDEDILNTSDVNSAMIRLNLYLDNLIKKINIRISEEKHKESFCNKREEYIENDELVLKRRKRSDK